MYILPLIVAGMFHFGAFGSAMPPNSAAPTNTLTNDAGTSNLTNDAGTAILTKA